MAKKLPDLQVLIPYSQLVELLSASERLGKVEDDTKRLRKELEGLRGILTETMERIGELT